MGRQMGLVRFFGYYNRLFNRRWSSIISILLYYMSYTEIYNLCKSGKTGIIPGWKGYIKYSYSNNELYFINEDYIMK